MLAVVTVFAERENAGMENPDAKRMNVDHFYVLINFVIHYIDRAEDRDAFSRVCKECCKADRETRKHVTISMCYSTTPQQLLQKFPNLQSLQLKGKPRVDKFSLIPANWGGSATQWVDNFHKFKCLKAVHFRRMVVSDEDLLTLSKLKGNLMSLKLDRCSGFSTKGLRYICQNCKNLRVLFMEGSSIVENNDGGEWLNDLVVNNTVLETLNFASTDFEEIKIEKLELIAQHCPNLSSVKITEIEVWELKNFFRHASSLQEFAGGIYDRVDPTDYADVSLPQQLSRLGLGFIRSDQLPNIVLPSTLKMLELYDVELNTGDHCTLIQRCPNLEILESTNAIGNEGLAALGHYCKNLKRLRIQQHDDDRGTVSYTGLNDLSEGCSKLEYLSLYVSDITNESLAAIGDRLKNLCDFRLTLLDIKENIDDFPLDNGVRALLSGCDKLRKFALYLNIDGGLTDNGLRYIAQNSPNVRWMLFGNVGETDEGLLEFSKGCPSLRKLDMRKCLHFSESALAEAATNLFEKETFRHLWVQGYRESAPGGSDLLAMNLPHSSIEITPYRIVNGKVHLTHVLAYRSLAVERTDIPNFVQTPTFQVMRVGVGR